ncbi:hypothetical protein VaNZ11_016079, partial [Volvox africanus]
MRPEDQFHDYTLASKLERFVAAVEQTLVSWQRTGLSEIIQRGYRCRIKEQPSQVKVCASLQHRLPWRREPYILQLHLPTSLALGRGGVPYSSPYTASESGRDRHQQLAPQQQPSSDAAATAAAATAGPPPPSSSSLVTTAFEAMSARPLTEEHPPGLMHLPDPHSSREGPGPGPGQQPALEEDVSGGVAAEGSGGGTSAVGIGAPMSGSGGDPLSYSRAYGSDEFAVRIRSESLRQGSQGEGRVQENTHGAESGTAAVIGEATRNSCDIGGRSPPSCGDGGAAAAVSGDVDGGGGGGSDANEAEPGWEVGVDLDLTDLLSQIDTIVNDVEAHDATALDLDPGGSRSSGLTAGDGGGSGGSGNTEVTRTEAQESGGGSWEHPRQHRGLVRGQSDRSGGTEKLLELKISAGRQQPQQQQRQRQQQGPMGQVLELPASSVGDGGGGGRGHENAPFTHGSRAAAGPPQQAFSDTATAAAAATAAASSRLAAVYPSGRPTGLSWWLPTFQHRLQRWFGLDAFLLLHPASYSRRILDETEAGTILSAAALALGAASLSCPLLLPVHDGLRDAYWGVAVLQGVGCLHLKTDSLHISSPPRELTQLPMQLRALGEQLMPFSPSAAVACFDAAQGDDEQKQGAHPGRGPGPAAHGTSAAAVSTSKRGGGGSREDAGGSADGLQITWSACFTYRVTQPSRRLRVQVERWAAAAAAAAAARGQYTITAAAAGRSSSSGPVAAVADTTQEREPIAELHRGPPLDAWHHATVAAAVAGTHDGGGGGAPQSPRSTRIDIDAHHGDGTYGTDAFGDGGTREPYEDADEDAHDGFGVFSDADPWDARAPWHPWAVQTDPVAVLELDVAWEDLQVPLQLSESGGQQHQQQDLPVLRPGSSPRWLLHALQVG